MLLRDSVHKEIRGAILNCELQPGQELREDVLSRQFQVSRSPVRDALLRLEQEHLVTVLPRRGYRVNAISMADVDDLFDLRLLIQPACAAAAAGADDTALRALDRFRSGGIHDQNETRFIDHNTAFHHTIDDLTGNARMAALARDLDEQVGRLVRISLRLLGQEPFRLARSEHEAIIAALQAHDRDLAYRLAYEHLTTGHSRLAAALRQL